MSATPSDFGETEAPLTEDEAFLGAARCLDCGVCSECHACVDACPADAINLDMAGAGDRGRGRRRRPGHRLQALPGRRQAAVRLRPPQERDHRHADGPPAGADAALQRRAAPQRRQGARQHRLRHVHRLARRDRRQPAVLQDLLHVLGQAEPAHHGRPAAGRRDRLLHRRALGGQGLRRVLPAGQGHGRQLRQGPWSRASPRPARATSCCATKTSRTAARWPRPSTTWSCWPSACSPTPRRSTSSQTAPWRSTTTTTSARPTKTSTPAAPTCPACSSPARPPAPRTSPIPSSTRARRSPRPPRTWRRAKVKVSA